MVVEAIACKRSAKTRKTLCSVLRNDKHSFSPQYWKECLKFEDCLHGPFKVVDETLQGKEGSNGGAIQNGREILLQAFNWESHKHDWWHNLERKVGDIAKSGFTSAWLPPATNSLSKEGYLPQNLYCLNSSYGSHDRLKSLLQKMHQHKVRAMADIVINHRVGTARGHGGAYNRYDGIPMSWDERAVTSCSGGLGSRSYGENFHGVPNIDHSQAFVRKDIIGWLKWLRKTIGFQDFRFDFAKGYDPKFVKEYVEESKPVFSMGDYWDNCNYAAPNYRLDYNQDSHRQRIINWIDKTGQVSAAFDFTTKGILQPPGVLGWWPSRAVTFIENHVTGSTQGHWPFPSDHVMEMDIRCRQDIHSRSKIKILEARSNLYAANIDDKGSRSYGENFHGVPNIDHSQAFVRKDIIGWLKWLRKTIGFQDFRFDFAKEYDPKFVKEYVEESKPVFSVGEYWDSCNYAGPDYRLDYNQDSHRQRIINWIDKTGQVSAAFDFTTKGILQEAVKGQLWRLRDSQGKPPGVLGWWPSRAVTFIENHVTGSTQGHWPFPSDHVMEGYVYILTHPGISTVFYDHFYDWGNSYHDQIVKLRLLAFCPSPSHPSLVNMEKLIDGGGHPANRSLLASLCETHVTERPPLQAARGFILS
ncbi:Alpha-amylase C-terminal beta-sheet domain [Musa troglodytarum]|uniref:1,4-alpha-D-glucan glucanohydrolase n=1 Tax=Musa troglodytarum TaxID=320322 RepID=A0A9E7FLC6_9LILI|nr:Alpha-amylase C-terminal beta-sheet domain [Musa troglodytarum]